MLEGLEFNPDSPLLRHLCFFSFPKELKLRVNEEQDYTCARCGTRVNWMGPHHIIPEKALQRRGIKGKNVRENAVGLCSGEGHGGMNSEGDCHEICDQMAIHENKFWHDGRFVDLGEIDPNTYSGCLRPFQERRAKHHKIRERRHHHHR